MMNNKCSQNLESGEVIKENLSRDSRIKGWGVRHTQCIILFLALTVAYSMRACMGVALVAMVDDHKEQLSVSSENGTSPEVNSSQIAMQDGEVNGLMITPPFPKFEWSKKVQDTILASFFWGYMSLQLPAGHIAHRFGARRLLVGAMFLNGVIPLIFPIVTYYGGWISAVICRIGQGMGQACVVPGIHTILGRWAPLEERGRMTAMIYGGQAIGTVLGLPITGFIGSSYLGWPGIFRFYGILSGIICLVLWFWLADTPAQHPTISLAERQYIEDALGQKHGTKSLPVPWKKILRSRGMWAIIVAHVGNTWGQLTLFSEIPSFMDKVMGVNIKANGLLTALPFMVMWFTNFFYSWLTDMLIVKKWLSVTNARKLANSIGFVPSSLLFIALAYAPANIYVIESILVLICSFKIAAHVGFHVNHVDISPNFAGTMMSISNFASNAVGSLAPIVAGLILTDATDANLWRTVFFISSALYFCTNLFYIFLGSGELADWNHPPEYEKVALDEKEEADKQEGTRDKKL